MVMSSTEFLNLPAVHWITCRRYCACIWKRLSGQYIVTDLGNGIKEGTRFSHAGAIIEGSRGTYQGKVNSLRDAGAVVVDDISDISGEVKKILDKLEIPYVRD
jgi:succinyl-CoA synthetase alpha subunit